MSSPTPKKDPTTKSGTGVKAKGAPPKWSTAGLASRREHNRAKRKEIEAQETAGMKERALAAYEGGGAVRKPGRPTSYTKAQGEDMCAWIAAGNSLRGWCIRNKVGLRTVYQWISAQRELQVLYGEACEHRADSLADELTDIADAPAPEDGLTMEEVQLRRLRIDTRKWVAAHLRPARWGDSAPTATAGSITIQIGIPERAPTEVIEAVQPTTVALSA